MKKYTDPYKFFDGKFPDEGELLLKKKELLLEFDIASNPTIFIGNNQYDKNTIIHIFDDFKVHYDSYKTLSENDGIKQYLNGSGLVDTSSFANIKGDNAFLIWLQPYINYTMFQNLKNNFNLENKNKFFQHKAIADTTSNYFAGYNDSLNAKMEQHCDDYITTLLDKYTNFKFYDITFRDEEIVEEWTASKHEMIVEYFSDSTFIHKYQLSIRQIIFVLLKASMNNISNLSSILIKRILYFEMYLAKHGMECFTKDGIQQITNILKQRVYAKRRKYALMSLPIFIYLIYLASPYIIKGVNELTFKIKGEISISNHDTSPKRVFIEFQQNTIPNESKPIPELYFDLLKPYFPLADTFVLEGTMTNYKHRFNEEDVKTVFKYIVIKNNSALGYEFINDLEFFKQDLYLNCDFSPRYKLLGFYPDFKHTNTNGSQIAMGIFELIPTATGDGYAIQYYNQKRELTDVDSYFHPSILNDNTDFETLTTPKKMLYDYFLLNKMIMSHGKAEIKINPRLSYYFSNSKNLICEALPGMTDDQFVVKVSGMEGNEKMYYHYTRKGNGLGGSSVYTELPVSSNDENMLNRLSQKLYDYPDKNEINVDMALIYSEVKWIIGPH